MAFDDVLISDRGLDKVVTLPHRELAKAYYASGISRSFDPCDRCQYLAMAIRGWKQLGIERDELRRIKQELHALTARIETVTEGVIRKGGIGENIPRSEVNTNIGRPGQTIIITNSPSPHTDKIKK